MNLREKQNMLKAILQRLTKMKDEIDSEIEDMNSDPYEMECDDALIYEMAKDAVAEIESTMIQELIA